MQRVGEPHLAQRVLVLVEGEPVEAHGDAATALDEFGNRRDAGTDDQVRTGVDDDGRAAFGEQLHFVRAQIDAMRERHSFVQQPDLVKIMHDTLRECTVGPGALVLRLQQMHVHPPARPRRGFANKPQHRVGTPLYASRPVLHGDAVAFDLGGHRLDHRHLIGRRQRLAQEAPRHAFASGRRQLRQQRLMWIVDQRIEITAVDRQCHANADIAGRFRHDLRFGRKIG